MLNKQLSTTEHSPEKQLTYKHPSFTDHFTEFNYICPIASAFLFSFSTMKRYLLALSMGCTVIASMALASPVTGIAPIADCSMIVADTTPAAPRTYRHEVIALPDGTYGYDIFTGNRKLIHQATIPGIPGDKGFSRKGAADSVAYLVISKLKRNIFPPTVTPAELRQLRAL